MKYVFFTPLYFDKFKRICKKIFETGEPGVFISIKSAAPDVRIDHFIQSEGTNFYLKVPIDINIVSVEDIERIILSKIRSISEKLCIFFTHSEHIVKMENFRLLEEICALRKKYRNLSFIFMSEIDVTHPKIASNFTSSRIFSSIQFYELYNQADMMRYIEYQCNEWSMSVNNRLKKEIVEYCGGHMWLIKEAIRSIKINDYNSIDQITTAYGFQLKVRMIFDSFLNSELNVLKRISSFPETQFNGDELHSFEYFKKIGLIKKNKITVRALIDHVEVLKNKLKVSYKNGLLYIDNVVVDSALSTRQKKIIECLILSRGKIISRNEIAKKIWSSNTEYYYTDWALDRIIARTRKKLAKLGLPDNFIITVRGKGYFTPNTILI